MQPEIESATMINGRRVQVMMVPFVPRKLEVLNRRSGTLLRCQSIANKPAKDL